MPKIPVSDSLSASCLLLYLNCRNDKTAQETKVCEQPSLIYVVVLESLTRSKKQNDHPDLIQQAHSSSFAGALQNHIYREKASFHTPGHKGRLSFNEKRTLPLEQDLTELAGLDEWAEPSGIIADLENRASKVWGSRSSLISVNGASAAIKAGLWACRSHHALNARRVIMPQNAHKSALEAAILMDLDITWANPNWDEDLGIWLDVDRAALASAYDEVCSSSGPSVPGDRVLVMITSPTYQGFGSDIADLSSYCREQGLILFVDEAHGAQIVDGGAIAAGADLVAHSLHKVLPGLTQTGLLHIGSHCQWPELDLECVRSSLSMFTSTSPSYLLMASIELAVRTHDQALVERLALLRARLQQGLSHNKLIDLVAHPLCVSQAHILLAPAAGCSFSMREIQAYLEGAGIFAEALMGAGGDLLLLMLGTGSNEDDIDYLIDVLDELGKSSSGSFSFLSSSKQRAHYPLPARRRIVRSCADAWRSPTAQIDAADALGRTSAQLICQCPPGIPLLVPGQIIDEEVLSKADRKQFLVVADTLE